jgi:hypothetical protein
MIMAKQVGDIILVGTIDDITFYEMEGKGYARRKSSLTGKKVKKDPQFTRTMESAQRFGRGNQLASKVYRSLSRQEQVYALFKELKRIAVRGLKEGMNEEEVLAMMQQRVRKDRAPRSATAIAPKKRPHVQRRVPCTKKLFGARGRRKQKRAPLGRKPQVTVRRE